MRYGEEVRVFFLEYTPLGQHHARVAVNDFSCLVHCPVNHVGNNVLNQFFYVTV
jgi:hypothetical protein